LKRTAWKIGEIADRTGITIRTLHHYHDIGLLIPSGMTDAGHRLYSNDDIICLQQIISLKQFGFRLDKIKAILDGKNFNPLEIIRKQLQVVEENLKSQSKLKSQLETILSILLKNEANTEEFIKLIGVLNMDKITLEVGLKAVPLVDKNEGAVLIERIHELRKSMDFPPIRILDNLILGENEYRILIFGKEVFRDQCKLTNNSLSENIEIILNNLKREIESHIEELK
jgi:DNA-binding transcriptional MerR regulator